MSDEPGAEDQRQIGPRIIGVAEERTLPIVKQKLREKPKREPLPWPELRAYVAAISADASTTELKDLFRAFPPKLREEVTENVRTFQKGARRPVSQHAAKQLARASHTARRQKKSAGPSTEIADALAQAMAAELIASLDPERAAEAILPKRDLLDREARAARRKQKIEEERRRDDERRRRREDQRGAKQQTSFGETSGTRIKGLDEIAAKLFADAAPAEPLTADETDESVSSETLNAADRTDESVSSEALNAADETDESVSSETGTSSGEAADG